MIQGKTESTINAYLDLSNVLYDRTSWSQIRYLFKFTNDMDKTVSYSYCQTVTDKYRFTKCTFTYNTSPDIYSGQIKLLPAGYYKYEVYAVLWSGTVTLASGNAPATETDVLSPAASNKGVVQGIITKGKMLLLEKSGTEQVQYTTRTEPSSTNYIYYGQ